MDVWSTMVAKKNASFVALCHTTQTVSQGIFCFLRTGFGRRKQLSKSLSFVPFQVD